MNTLALIVIDMQVGNFTGINPIYMGKELLSNVLSLIAHLRSIETPIIYIQNNGGKGDPDELGTPGWDIHPSIAPIEGDILIQKTTPDGFHETLLKFELESLRITKMIIVGLQSEYCIDTTCRRAFSEGYEVILVEDAHSTWDSELLNAQQIIDHHNLVLSSWFVTLKRVKEIISDYQL
ncbi:MAG: cysteine hydrolase family protein [Candidatus Hodarchaeota archaeon]